MASSRLTILAPQPGVNRGYWVSFVGEMLRRLTAEYETVVVESPHGPLHTAATPGDEVVIGVAPSRETVPPPGPHVWIPRIGEPVERTHPWSSAGVILLPLGVGAVDASLPVTHLGAGLPHAEGQPDKAGPHPADNVPGIIKVRPDGEDCVTSFLAALAKGCIPIVPADSPLLAYLCERWKLGLPCGDESEATAAQRYLEGNPTVAHRMSDAGRRFITRSLSWPRVYRRFRAGVRAVESPLAVTHVIVLNWNGRDLLPDCLESLRDQCYPRMVPVVVDNGSGDGSPAFVASVFPECRVIVNRRNLGFAEGNNVGMRVAIEERAEHVVLLNNDTRVARGWLKALISRAGESADIGAVGSRMLFFDRPRTVNSAGGAMNQSLYGWDRGVFEHDARKWRQPEDCLSVTGGSVLLRVDALRASGLLDKVYFAYYEDTDLCHRIRLAGWRVVYAPASKVFHKLSATSGPVSEWKTFLLERSRYRFILKNVPLSYLARHGNRLLGQEWGELQSWWRAREYRRVLAQLRAAFSACAKLPGIVAWRVLSGSGRDSDWTAELTPGFARPSFPGADEEFADLYAGMTPEGRTIPTCVCTSLRGEWSAVQATFPKVRMIGGWCALNMTNHRIAEGNLQVHLFLPPDRSSAELTLLCPPEGPRTVTIPHPGWHTLILPIRNVPARAVVELSASHPLGINEVSLLPSGSALLRSG
ncbi:MAG: glycosyltransferase [Candidatus Eisenbacteria bacterium]|nr:glycosyltransferase [Candidatus Eisenbacteria bacterium]